MAVGGAEAHRGRGPLPEKRRDQYALAVRKTDIIGVGKVLGAPACRILRGKPAGGDPGGAERDHGRQAERYQTNPILMLATDWLPTGYRLEAAAAARNRRAITSQAVSESASMAWKSSCIDQNCSDTAKIQSESGH